MNGKCWASTSYFARIYEVSKVSIQKWLKILEDNNYITRTVTYKTGSKEILSRVITLRNRPSKEKLTDNNNTKVYNNTNITYNNKGKSTMSKIDSQINAWEEAKKLL